MLSIVQQRNRSLVFTQMQRSALLFGLVLFAVALPTSVSAESPGEGGRASRPQAPKVQKAKFGNVQVVYKCGNIWMASQPTPADLELMAKQGVACVVTLRTDEEVDWDEQGTVEKLGMDFRKIPVSSIESLTDEVFTEARKLMKENAETPIFVHCGAAVRVAAVWAAYRVLDQGVSLEVALTEAEAVGLRSPKMKARVAEYIGSHQK